MNTETCRSNFNGNFILLCVFVGVVINTKCIPYFRSTEFKVTIFKVLVTAAQLVLVVLLLHSKFPQCYR